MQNRSHIGVLILPILVYACILAGYWPVIQKLLIRWGNDDNSYCYLVIPMFFYLCWEKKNHFKFDQFSWSFWAILPAAMSVFLLFAGEFASVESLLYVGLWGGITSVIIASYGWKRSLTGLWFPLFILCFIVPLPPFLNQILTFKMKMAASSLSVEMLRAVGVSVLQEGNVLDLGITKLQVVDACSGLRYVVSMLLMALLIGHFFVTGWWRRVLLVSLVGPLSILINAGRIFVTGLFAIQGYSFMTEGPLHDSAGIIAFLIAGAFLSLFANFSMKIGHKKEEELWVDPGPGQARVSNSKAILLAVCLSALFVGSGWALRNTGSVLTIPPRHSLASFPMEIDGWKGVRTELSQDILDSLWADDYVNATFTRPDSGKTIFVLIPYYEYQGTRHTVHAPQSCLLGGGWAISSSGTMTVTAGGEDKKIGMMHLKKDNYQMLASYFFLQRGRVLTSPWQNKFYLMVDAIKRGRTDGALVRVEILMSGDEDVEDSKALLQNFLGKLWPILGEYIPD